MEERMKKGGKKKVLIPGKTGHDVRKNSNIFMKLNIFKQKKIFDSADYYKDQEEKDKHTS